MKIQKILKIFFSILLIVSFNSCISLKSPNKIKNYVLFETTHGNFVVGTYSFCKQHSENFINNIENGIYDSTNVYSIVKYGVLKAGSKNEEEEYILMRDNLKNNKGIKPEFHKKLINKKGAVGMWRLANDENPEKLSDPIIFYIVDGFKSDETILKTLVAKRNAPLIAEYMTRWLNQPENKHYKDSLDFYQTNGNRNQYLKLYGELSKNVVPLIEKDGKKLFKLNSYQQKKYSTTAGIPIYDYNYTVFGEIVYGMDIIDKITTIKTKIKNKPTENIIILSSKIISKKEIKKLMNK